MAEKTGDVDENVLAQRIDLAAVVAKASEIIGERAEMAEQHPPFDSPAQRRPLVVLEIDATGFLQIADHVLKAIFCVGGGGRRLVRRSVQILVTANVLEFFGD